MAPRTKAKLEWSVRCPACNVILLDLENPVELHDHVLMKHILSNKHGSTHLTPQELRLMYVLLVTHPHTVGEEKLGHMLSETGSEKILHVVVAKLRPKILPLQIKILNSWKGYYLELPE